MEMETSLPKRAAAEKRLHSPAKSPMPNFLPVTLANISHNKVPVLD